MDAAAVGVTEEEEREQGMHEQGMLDGVILFLAALTRRLCRRVLGADDASFGPVMGKRGAGAGAGSFSSGVTTAAAAVPETPRRCARAVRERDGASPRVRSAASKAGNRT